MIDGYYFNIRVLVRHPSMPVSNLISYMGEEPDYSREPKSGRGSFWSLRSETRGRRDFFSEVSDVISWLEGKTAAVQSILASGGSIMVIVEIPGDRNTGDTWEPGDMARAAALGISLGVEVFPHIRGVTREAEL